MISSEVKSIFKFLETEFGLLCRQARQESWGFGATYTGQANQVQLIYENREHYLTIKLGSHDEIFDLDDLADLAGESPPSPDGQTLDETLLVQARRLKTYGVRILNGDFSQFPELRERVLARVESIGRR